MTNDPPTNDPTNGPFSNIYADGTRAHAYATLEFPGTYSLAFRDLPGIIAQHVTGTRAVDFGCGAGRSTRFLRDQGFEPVGVDISEAMLAHAKSVDPQGDYRLVPDGDIGNLEAGGFDLVLCAFTFDNVPTSEKKVALFRRLANLLDERGRIVNVVSSENLYLYEWASFSTKDFPENRNAKPGDVVQLIMLDVEDRRPVQDILWPDQAYREVYRDAGLEMIDVYRPLGVSGEPYAWISETSVAPWNIYVLARST